MKDLIQYTISSSGKITEKKSWCEFYPTRAKKNIESVEVHLKPDSLPFLNFDSNFHMCVHTMHRMGQWTEATWRLG